MIFNRLRPSHEACATNVSNGALEAGLLRIYSNMVHTHNTDTQYLLFYVYMNTTKTDYIRSYYEPAYNIIFVITIVSRDKMAEVQINMYSCNDYIYRCIISAFKTNIQRITKIQSSVEQVIKILNLEITQLTAYMGTKFDSYIPEIMKGRAGWIHLDPSGSIWIHLDP